MSLLRTIEIHEDVMADNNKRAIEVRSYLKENNVYMLNFMSSPGSGKTTTLTYLINALKDKKRIALMNVDIKTDKDARTIQSKTNVRALQINNGGLCHIDADMTKRAIDDFGIEDTDLLILENIGNLVCPAEFDTGANKNIMLLSVPEGDDKPLKYPLMFSICDCVLINKIDTLPYFDFDFEACKKRILDLNPKTKIFKISAKTGEGMAEFIDWLLKEME